MKEFSQLMQIMSEFGQGRLFSQSTLEKAWNIAFLKIILEVAKANGGRAPRKDWIKGAEVQPVPVPQDPAQPLPALEWL